MTYDVTLGVAPGEGRLARRDRAVLFVPDATDAANFIAAFIRAPHDELEATLAQHVLDHKTDAPDFTFVSWPAQPDGDRLQVLVRGDMAVTSDLESMPRLSGAGSSTWVEHRVLGNPQTADIRGGVDAAHDTDLAGGVVVAGGFALRIEADSDAAQHADDAPATIDSPAAAQLPVDPHVEPPPSTQSPTSAVSSFGLEALAAASGADWMEESLQLGGSKPSGSDGPPPSPPPAAPADPTAGSVRPSPDPAPPSQPGPPKFPANDPDSETTLDAEALAKRSSAQLPVDRQQGANGERRTEARLCPAGHPNSPHDTDCRLCSEPIAVGESVVTVEQPVLARLRLPDDTVIGIAGDIVIGRNPTCAGAKADQARLVAISAASSVSRTHLLISVDGWRILVTDCGSRAGSALLVDGDDDPIELQPWLPHEINGGDRLYLGGPTCLTIEEESR